MMGQKPRSISLYDLAHHKGNWFKRHLKRLNSLKFTAPPTLWQAIYTNTGPLLVHHWSCIKHVLFLTNQLATMVWPKQVHYPSKCVTHWVQPSGSHDNCTSMWYLIYLNTMSITQFNSHTNNIFTDSIS